MPRQSTDHIDNPVALGVRLREARLRSGLRQADLAFPGCSIGYISRIESGARAPSLQVIRRLAAGVGVSEGWIARGGDAVESQASEQLRDASIALRLDQPDEAEAGFSEATRFTKDPVLLARAEAGLGQVAFRRGSAHEAVAHLERAFELDPRLDDPSAADTLGRCYGQIGNSTAAVQLFTAWIERCVSHHDPAGRLRFAVLLANALIDRGDHQSAGVLLSRVLEETDAGDPIALARVYWSRSRLMALSHDRDGAARYARRALDLLETSEHTYFRARAHGLLAYAELDAGRAHEAHALIQRGRLLLGADGSTFDLAWFDLEEARALAQLGSPEEAAALAMRAASTMAGEGHPGDVARCYAELARSFDTRGDTARAIELYELAIEFLDGTTATFFPTILTDYAAILERTGHTQQALNAYKRAATVAATPQATP
jgi:tetratricopeptide (TPR) repeat protein